MSRTLKQLADYFAVEFSGAADCLIMQVADISTAVAGEITFYTNPKFKSWLKTTQASAVILRPADARFCETATLQTDNPYALYAKIAALLNPDMDMLQPSGIHPTAIIAPNTVIADTAIIAAHTVIEAGVSIAAGSYIGPGTVLKRNVKIGANCKLVANITIAADCQLGDRVLIHPSAVIGADGFGFASENKQWLKIPQLGKVIIGNDVEIGANTTIDRGALRDTIIGDGVKLDNQVHIAHNVTIGANTAIAAQTGIAGSAEIGENCAIGGGVGISGHLQIISGVTLNGFAHVTQSITEPGHYASGSPLEPVARWRRNWARAKQLDQLAKRVQQLEQKLAD